VLKRYKGEIEQWDCINESLNEFDREMNPKYAYFGMGMN